MKGTTNDAKELRKTLEAVGYEDFKLPRKGQRLMLTCNATSYLQIDNTEGIYHVELVST